MSWIQISGALELGIIFAFVAFGVFLSFRTLQFPDMTTDGSFPLGAAVTASMIVNGYDPFVATGIACVAGGAAGLVTAWFSTHLKVLNLLAGILTMTALYSINFRVMGQVPNIPLFEEPTIFSHFFPELGPLPLLILLLLLIFMLIYFFLKTEFGLALRSIGSNPRMARANGINDQFMIFIGIGLANVLTALSGALWAQVHGFADLSVGVGMIVNGLAALIIGESLVQKKGVFMGLVACFVGAFAHRLVVACALNIGGLGLVSSDLQIVTAILVASAMLLPSLRRKLS